jgi:hypothetical protein
MEMAANLKREAEWADGKSCQIGREELAKDEEDEKMEEDEEEPSEEALPSPCPIDQLQEFGNGLNTAGKVAGTSHHDGSAENMANRQNGEVEGGEEMDEEMMDKEEKRALLEALVKVGYCF